MKLYIASTAAAMDKLRPLWERLFAATPTATLFQSFSWNRLAAECFAPRQRPHIVAGESQSGAAIIPAAVGREGLTLLGEALFDYRDVLRAGDEAPLRAAWAALARLQLSLHVSALRGRGCQHWKEFAPVRYVGAPQVRRREASPDAFAGAHPRLRRALRRVAEQGIHLRHRCGADGNLARWVYRQKALQFHDSSDNLFADPARIDFMTAACAMDAGCDLFTLEKADHIVAALVTFRDREVRRFYTVYYDPAWAQYSPGIALLFEVTRRSLAEGLDCDYMTGEQPHKTRLMTSSVPLYRVNASAEAVARAAAAPQVEVAA